jgi:hypothetical protein
MGDQTYTTPPEYVAAVAAQVPCSTCGDGPGAPAHQSVEECGEECKAPGEHHVYRANPASLEARYVDAVTLARDLAEALDAATDDPAERHRYAALMKRARAAGLLV